MRSCCDGCQSSSSWQLCSDSWEPGRELCRGLPTVTVSNLTTGGQPSLLLPVSKTDRDIVSCVGEMRDVTRTISGAGCGDFDGVLRLWKWSKDEVLSPHQQLTRAGNGASDTLLHIVFLKALFLFLRK